MADHGPADEDESTATNARERSLDRETIRTVLASHPVRLAVVFGSQVQGTPDARSDVDIAVELTPAASADAASVRMALLADLSSALDRNDIDLSLVGDLAPRVGRAAFTEGELLLGSPGRAERHRQAFDRRVTEQSRADLRERFDAVLDHVDEAVGERA